MSNEEDVQPLLEGSGPPRVTEPCGQGCRCAELLCGALFSGDGSEASPYEVYPLEES